jgi:hypothetical protein
MLAMTTLPATTAHRSALPHMLRPRVIAGDFAYLILGLPLGIASFTVVVTGVSLAAGLLITLIGIPVLMATLLAARGFAVVERARAALVLGEPIPAPERAWRRETVWETTKAVLSDPGGWRDLLWSVVLMPIGIATFTVAVTLWASALGLLTSPIWYWALPEDDDTGVTLFESTAAGYSVLRVLIGLALVPIAIAVCRGVAVGQARATAIAIGRHPQVGA